MSAKALLLTGISCIATGVLVGLLTAPSSGKETRKKIAEKADDLTKRFNGLKGLAMEDVSELKHIFEDEAIGLKEDVRQRVLNLLNAAGNKKAAIEKHWAASN